MRRKLGTGDLSPHIAGRDPDLGIVPDSFALAGIALGHHIDLAVSFREPDRCWDCNSILAEGGKTDVALVLEFGGERIRHDSILVRWQWGCLPCEVRELASGLPAAPRLCYKPYMRKWMSERLKRRKKAQEKKSSEPAPAPLQPAYFDAEAAPAETATPNEPEVNTDSGLLESPEPSEASVVADRVESQSGQGSPQRPRRRKSRGGRGRGGQRSSAPAAEAQASAPASPSVDAAKPADFAPAVPAAPPRPPKGTVVLAIGLPGSGKSSWFKRNNITPLSSDMVRLLLFDDSQEQRFQDLVFSNLRSMLKARLIARRPMNYVDATNLTPHERSSWVKLAKDYGYEVQAVFFDVPLEVCLERNRRRDRTVDEDVMRRMAAKLKAPTFEEGFSKVTVVRVKKKDNEVAS